MGCYTVPLASAIILYLFRRKHSSFGSVSYYWLNLLFAGAAIFGVVDHWWNGELFVFSFSDLVLGFAITIAILVSWRIMIFYDNSSLKISYKVRN